MKKMSFAKAGIHLLALCFLAGCTSTKAIYKNYDNLVHLENGVNAEQAKIIAQRKLIDTEEKDSYRISFPDIKTGPIGLQISGLLVCGLWA